MIYHNICNKRGFLVAQITKESTCNAGNPGSISGLGRSPWEGNGNPLQCSCLQNPIDRGAWRATVNGIAELDTTERLTQTCIKRLWILYEGFYQKFRKFTNPYGNYSIILIHGHQNLTSKLCNDNLGKKIM